MGSFTTAAVMRV